MRRSRPRPHLVLRRVLGYGFHEDGVTSAPACALRWEFLVNSAIFEGSVFHRRLQPVAHEFAYRSRSPSSISTKSMRSAHATLSGRTVTECGTVPPARLLRPSGAAPLRIDPRSGAGTHRQSAYRPRADACPPPHVGLAVESDCVLLVLGRNGHERRGVRRGRDQHTVARTPRVRDPSHRRRCMGGQGTARVAVPVNGSALSHHEPRAHRPHHGADREPSGRQSCVRRRHCRDVPPHQPIVTRASALATSALDGTRVGTHLRRSRPARD